MKSKILRSVISTIALLPKQIDKEQYLMSVVDTIRSHCGFHFVGLFLVDTNRQTAVLRIGTEDVGQKLMTLGHKFRLDENKTMIAQVINLGELHVNQPVYPAPYYWGSRSYKASLPSIIPFGATLDFHLVDEVAPVNWYFMSAIPSPPLWELCLPMRMGEFVFGALHIWILLPLKTETRLTCAGPMWIEPDQYIDFALVDCANVQWLADQVSVLLDSNGIIYDGIVE